jgi:nucleoside-diphosphate-sugar epimerase
MGKERLLITGSSGVIGSVLRKGLSGDFDIYGVDLKPAPHDRSFGADTSRFDQVMEAFRWADPVRLIVHLAGDPRVDAEWETVLTGHIIGTRNVYEAARQSGAGRIVLASSNHVTGAYEGFPPRLHESKNRRLIAARDPVRPDSDYGSGKVFGEAVARQYHEWFGIESVCLRIGTVRADDDPTGSERTKATWLSHRDLIQLARKSLLSKVKFGIYYGVSNNRNRIWDISDAGEEIGYFPEDDAARLSEG